MFIYPKWASGRIGSTKLLNGYFHPPFSTKCKEVRKFLPEKWEDSSSIVYSSMTNGRFLKLDACCDPPVVIPRCDSHMDNSPAMVNAPGAQLPRRGQAERSSTTKVSCGTSRRRGYSARALLVDLCWCLGTTAENENRGWKPWRIFGQNQLHVSCWQSDLRESAKLKTVNVQNGRVWCLLESPDLYGCG